MKMDKVEMNKVHRLPPSYPPQQVLIGTEAPDLQHYCPEERWRNVYEEPEHERLT